MFQIIDQITDEYGNARLNWQLEVYDLSTGDPVTMYADYAGTIPIEDVSFIENRLVSDRFGNFTGGYVTPGTYGKRYYDDQGVLKRTVEGLDMYGATFPGNLVGTGDNAPVFTITSGEMFNNGSSDVPLVPLEGLTNIQDSLGVVHLAVWPDLDGDGDYDADFWFKSNGYIAATASLHFRFGDNDQLNGAGFSERGRIRMGCTGNAAGAGTTNVNFLQSGVNFSGTTFNDFAIGPYGSSAWWTYWDYETGNVGVGTSTPATRLHVVDATSTVSLFENTNSAVARISAKGSTTTSATSVMWGASGDDAVLYAGGLIRLQLYSTGEVLSRAGALGYASGAGGSVTQLTSKATGVTLDKPCGQIVTHNAALAASAIVSFTVTNSVIAATDTVTIHRASGGTAASYRVWVDSVAAGSFVVCLQNISGGSLSEALTLSFSAIKAVAA